MKAFKKSSSAKAASVSGYVVRIGDLYIPLDSRELVMIDVIHPSGRITGCVTIRHLERLGNANWATAEKGNEYPMMPKETSHG